VPSIQVLHLTHKDTVYSAREALSYAEPQSQVWLVLPYRVRWARNLVNLKLLKRAAEHKDIELHIVSLHGDTRLLARQAGLIPHLILPPGLQQYRVDRPESRSLSERMVTSGIQLAPDWVRRPTTLGPGTVLVSVGLVIGLIAALLATAGAFVPAATVTLRPVAQEVQATMDITADPRYTAIQYGLGIIPARSVQAIVSGRGEVPATGITDIPDAHASGQVILANRTDEPVLVPKGTVVRTGAGVPVRFVTVGDVEVPARLYAQARVGIVAEAPGPAGNVAALTINVVEGPLGSMVDVLNDSPTTGGTVTSVAVIAPEDLDAVRAETVQRLGAQAYEELIPQLGPREFVPEDSLEVLIMSQHFDQVIGQRSEVASMEMKVVARGLALDSEVMEELATWLLEQAAGGSADLAVIPDSLEVSRSPGYRTDENTYALSISARGMVAPVIDVESVERHIAGKSRADAKDWLLANLPLSDEPALDVWPPWWPFLPRLRGRLDVRVSTAVD